MLQPRTCIFCHVSLAVSTRVVAVKRRNEDNTIFSYIYGGQPDATCTAKNASYEI